MLCPCKRSASDLSDYQFIISHKFSCLELDKTRNHTAPAAVHRKHFFVPEDKIVLRQSFFNYRNETLVALLHFEDKKTSNLCFTQICCFAECHFGVVAEIGRRVPGYTAEKFTKMSRIGKLHPVCYL